MENIIIPTELFNKIKNDLDGLVFHRDNPTLKCTEIKFIKKLARYIPNTVIELLNENKVN